MIAPIFIPTLSPTPSLSSLQHAKHIHFSFSTTYTLQPTKQLPSLSRASQTKPNLSLVLACLPSSSSSSSSSSAPRTRLYVSGLSFRTTEESLRNAFQDFGKLVKVNLVMDNIANRPRGFAFLHYSTEEESQNAIQGMHGKFLDGRVIFVEVAKRRSELRKSTQDNQRRY